ncbi:MAG: hypothetical protein AAGA08_10470 [Pseudomonadota bacterium]
MKSYLKDGSLGHKSLNATSLQQITPLKARLTGPGALYNLGNVLALAAGLFISLRNAPEHAGAATVIYAHLIGSPDALWLSVSMLLFIISGEFYHRAFQSGQRPNLVAWGDFISGVAAIALTVALVLLGNTVLALLGGVLLTMGKLGTAFISFFSPNPMPRLDQTLRLTVVASRAPSIVALGLTVLPAILGDLPVSEVAIACVMIVCFLLWLWADLLLLRPD